MAQLTPIVGIGDFAAYGTGSPVTYTNINGVVSYARSGDKQEMQKTTTMATPSGVDTFIPSTYNPGTVDVKMLLYPADTTQVQLETFRAAGTLVPFKLGYGSANSLTFSGYVESLTEGGFTADKTPTLDLKIQISGSVVKT